MCVNYLPPTREQLLDVWDLDGDEDMWPAEVWQDYLAPIILGGARGRALRVANYGMVPKRHMPPGVRISTMNARAETVGELPTYRQAWQQGQLCLVPMQAFFEPCYESGRPERWKIGLADGRPFAVAGLWRAWREEDGSMSGAFTQLTINADDHALMKRMHKPGDEKRSLVIVPPEHYDDWLYCRNPEQARAFLAHYPAERMAAEPAPVPQQKQHEQAPEQGGLFDEPDS
jgi:putative SOS response-associated peptidase YedK